MQQIPFIDLFKSAVHVSGDKLAYPPEHFLTLYTGFATRHRYWCRPVTSFRWNGVPSGALYHKLWTQSSAPEDGRNYCPKHVELIVIISKICYCCICLAVYIIVCWADFEEFWKRVNVQNICRNNSNSSKFAQHLNDLMHTFGSVGNTLQILAKFSQIVYIIKLC